MRERVFDYGTTRQVVVDRADKTLIVCIDKVNNEGFMLMFHGLERLPVEGENGIIVFERDTTKGHWQYYPNPKNQ